MVGGRTWRFHCTNVRMCRFLTVSLSTKAPSSRIRVCLKTEIVFSVFKKKKNPRSHVAFLNGFCPSKRKRNSD